MPLEVIGAGYGRTGTMSLLKALQILGYRTHHGLSILEDDSADLGVFHRAYDHPDTHEDEWEKVYGDYTASLDFPSAAFYKELSEKYPDAKVILTIRPAEDWFKSMQKTILKEFAETPMTIGAEAMTKFLSHITFNGKLGKHLEKPADKEYMCQLFNDHTEQVKKTIPADRLLILHLGDGWEPLCRFLGKDIPNEPYPHKNTTDDFLNEFEEGKRIITSLLHSNSTEK
ncbi:P-loop containing nucleoside triphosphate hydrolase protein [Halteromyces radiatus]|uniref:P-loop containing nucleoside triphosphate hydrolase protein n=1 Tax=Halteromyces radiatus TaxID=101107 RepID=UPI002220360F|nr:P-loop containing nucleoside triphosphate hydrolase protein [Halteromyces radiatus]KAI8098790.1 P-loop containing nucleoside triphosphate hydrolase protein [Halteromyces radiatus]